MELAGVLAPSEISISKGTEPSIYQDSSVQAVIKQLVREDFIIKELANIFRKNDRLRKFTFGILQ